jgi:hypothetical protein
MLFYKKKFWVKNCSLIRLNIGWFGNIRVVFRNISCHSGRDPKPDRFIMEEKWTRCQKDNFGVWMLPRGDSFLYQFVAYHLSRTICPGHWAFHLPYTQTKNKRGRGQWILQNGCSPQITEANWLDGSGKILGGGGNNETIVCRLCFLLLRLDRWAISCFYDYIHTVQRWKRNVYEFGKRQGCQICLGTMYTSGEKYTKWPQKCTKWS